MQRKKAMPLGVNGAGEAGCIPVPAIMVATLEDAIVSLIDKGCCDFVNWLYCK